MQKREERLKQILTDLGSGDTSENGVPYGELKAVAEEFVNVKFEIDYLLQEAFVSTAQFEGIWNREYLFYRNPTASSLQDRRNIILKRIAAEKLICNVQGFSDFLDSLNITYTIEDDAINSVVTVTVTSPHSEREKLWISDQIKHYLGPLSTVNVIFNG